MIQTLIAAVAVAVLIGMSLRANRRFTNEERLPMQWSLSGSVNWTAPRAIALALMPILATIILVAAVASSILLEPRRGQEGLEIPVISFLALVFIAVHSLHLRLADKELRRNGR